MTFDDDFVRIHLIDCRLDVSCISLGFEWPPPEKFTILFSGRERTVMRQSMSFITDEQRASLKSICRGAEYREIVH